MRTELLHEAVRAALESEVGKPFGLVQAPVQNDGSRYELYGVVYPIIAGDEGGFDDLSGTLTPTYQIRSVATSVRQTAWLSDRIHTALVGLRAGGGYSLAIPVSGATVEDRWLLRLGSTLPSGERLFTQDDDYGMRVSNG